MMKGVWFDNTHSYDDLNLILSKVSIPPATPKTNFVDIPGGDGSVDLTEALGETKYKDRKCTFTFTVFPSDNFEEKKREVSDLVNGRRCKITVDKDPDYYWVGRCAINKYNSNKNINQIVVDVTVSPYKLKAYQTKIIVPAGTSVARTLWNSRKTVVPTITCAAEAQIVFKNIIYNMSAGTHRFLNFELTEGGNVITVTSEAPVEIVYQEGAL